ncbi:hypothetical protein [Acidithiobacillus sp. AMEEHan]|uniref:hypothetical protein n=1 Tax=Acidithiobacillus sp. AMEEHan TaxID=2994951 RepID=UPI0027E3B723|nr:hypothetical protein [Acidithiobacillus sp. AMEEHan]
MIHFVTPNGVEDDLVSYLVGLTGGARGRTRDGLQSPTGPILPREQLVDRQAAHCLGRGSDK